MRGYWITIAILFFVGLASAENITLIHPSDNDNCVTLPESYFSYTIDIASPTFCALYTNNSGVWVQEDLNLTPSTTQTNIFNVSLSPEITYWGIKCVNATDTFWSSNRTFTLVDAPYCAVISSTSCTPDVNLGSVGVFKFRLGNTRGFWLENQDCNVWVEDSTGKIVKAFDTMMYQQSVSLQLDKDGNWVNVADKKVPLTDSLGWYVIPFLLDKSWAWYGEEYELHAICNGQEAICEFNSTKERLPDMGNYEAIGKEGAGIFILGGGILFGVAVYVGSLWRKIRGK